MKKAILFYNAFSGNNTFGGKLDLIIENFQKHNIIVHLFRINSSESLLKETLKTEKYDFVVLSGGDGSINYEINQIIKNDINIPIGIIPAGTCNDFAVSLNINGDIKECVDIIANGKIQKVDVGLINDEHYFLSTFAMGVFAGVSYETSNELKKNLGPFAYYIKGAAEMIFKKSFDLKIEIDDNKIINEKAILLMISNGKNAAGMPNIVNSAEISDGLMDIIIIKDCHNLDMTKMFINLLNNNFRNDKNVMHFKSSKCIIEKAESDISISVDGEKFINQRQEIKFLNKKIEVFVR